MADATLRIAVNPIPTNGDPVSWAQWTAATGLEGSELEAGAVETALGVQGMSTTRLLKVAHASGIQLVQITPQNASSMLPTLRGYPQTVLDAIQAELNLNRNVTAPASPLPIFHGTRTEVGFWSLDPSTGEGRFVIGDQLLAGGFADLGNYYALPDVEPAAPSVPAPSSINPAVPTAIQLFGYALGAAAAAETAGALGDAALDLGKIAALGRPAREDGVTPPQLHPWLRVSLAVRAILTAPWPEGGWPAIKDDVSKALAPRARLAKAVWWS